MVYCLLAEKGQSGFLAAFDVLSVLEASHPSNGELLGANLVYK